MATQEQGPETTKQEAARGDFLVYTAVTGDYDRARDDIKVFSGFDKFREGVYNAKIYKILPHLFLDARVSMWVDGNIYPLKTDDEYLEILGDNDIALFAHPDRDCIFEEGEAAILRSTTLDISGEVREQLENYPVLPHSGLYSGGVLIRRHNDRVKRFNCEWWAHICRYSRRDQLSLPLVIEDLSVKIIPGNIFNNYLFRYEEHVS